MARTRHLRRLAKGRTFFQDADDPARTVYGAPNDEYRLKLLVGKPWDFALPTATANLAVLYPDRFTVNDIRVCDALGDLHRLGSRRWSKRSWVEYGRFTAAVRSAVPGRLSLRDADRWLWGQNKRRAIRRELRLD